MWETREISNAGASLEWIWLQIVQGQQVKEFGDALFLLLL